MWKNIKGFTLLEVMIAMAILAITLVTVGSLRNRDILYHEDVRQIITATLLAQERMTLLEMAEEYPALGERSGEFDDERYPQYRWTQTVLTTPFDFAREVRLRVYWGSGRPEESVEVISYVLEEK
jgi:general secretion pathway protein I